MMFGTARRKNGKFGRGNLYVAKQLILSRTAFRFPFGNTDCFTLISKCLKYYYL